MWLSDKKYPVMSIRQALTQYFDITKPLSQEALKILASQALNERDREILETLATVRKSQINFFLFNQNLNKIFFFKLILANELIVNLKIYFSIFKGLEKIRIMES